MLVVAYPNKDADTELEFKYWLGPADTYGDFGDASGAPVLLISMIAACLVVCCGVAAFLLYRRMRMAKIEDEHSARYGFDDRKIGRLAVRQPENNGSRNENSLRVPSIPNLSLNGSQVLPTQRSLLDFSQHREEANIDDDYEIRYHSGMIGEGLYGNQFQCIHLATQ